LRLRTNLEIYWDKLEWATGLPDSVLKVQRLPATQADLRYRGFSVFSQANASAPAVPDYNRLAGTTQKWRDLEGYYTRYGDVFAWLVVAGASILLARSWRASRPGD